MQKDDNFLFEVRYRENIVLYFQVVAFTLFYIIKQFLTIHWHTNKYIFKNKKERYTSNLTRKKGPHSQDYHLSKTAAIRSVLPARF